jgi:flagellar basal-body rod modification protein FlgD
MAIAPLGANSNTGLVTSNTGSTATTSASTTSDPNNPFASIGQGDFLKLLVAEMQNQDPMQPMDDTQFINQVTQLNSVEQITEMNQNLGQFLGLEQMAQASNLIGKKIEAQASGQSPVSGIVQQVQLQGTTPFLIVNGQQVALSDVQTIAAAS